MRRGQTLLTGLLLIALMVSSGVATATSITFTSNTTIACNDLTYEGYDVTVDNGATLTIACTHNFNSLTVTNGVVTQPAQDTLGLHLVVAGNVTVAAAGQINVDGKGYLSTQGPGGAPASNTYASGGTHAGVGGQAANAGAAPNPVCYGSAFQPAQLGSGGGSYFGNPGGTGGGAIFIHVGSQLTVNGIISANGIVGTTHTGGGAGGSIWLEAGTFAGAADISASGGPASTSGGGGGGGRVAIYYNTSSYSAAVTSYGGPGGNQRGGSGTVYLKNNASPNGALSYDNGGNAGNVSRAVFAGLGGDVTVTGSTQLIVTGGFSINSLLVNTGNTVSVAPGDSSTMSVATNATINGSMNADAAGHITGEGLGGAPVSNTYSSGGTYAGVGGLGFNGTAPSQNCYGSPTQPSYLGSGGGMYSGNPAGAGGGLIHLTVGNTLTVAGNLSARGGSGTNATGGGSGGSLWLSVGTWAGNGTISADGGIPNTSAGGGGGGRIAVYYNSRTFSGPISAVGGPAGGQRGGAGSIYLKDNANPVGSLLYDNAGITGNISRIPGASLVGNLTVSGNTELAIGSSATVNSLTVGANSILRPEALDPLTFTVQTDATIVGTFHSNGLGYPSTQGPGGAPNSNTYSSGGSHAGVGGQANGGTAPNQNCYGSLLQPVDFGSGGGSYITSNLGGTGGGAMHLIVADSLTVTGVLTTNGVTGATHTGGGAGGSLWLSVGTLVGNGTISADGGAASTQGGGGGGGRVAVYYNNLSFTGNLTALGGAAGNQRGGAGSVYRKRNSETIPRLAYDNGGISGAISRTDGSAVVGDLTVTGNAELVLSGAAAVNSLGVGANSILRPEALTALDVNVVSDANIAGTFHANALGYPTTQGPGGAANSNTYAGGAAYGGAGGNGNSAQQSIPSLNCYGSIVQPVDFGSGGGSYNVNSLGGTGGGVIHLVVMDSLTLAGTLSADAGAGVISGGGSGGSIWLNVGTLLGTGTIHANGGSTSNFGGGGGGGRVAVYYNNFSLGGTITAIGGVSSAEDGGAGSVYLKNNSSANGALTYSNGTSNGAATFVDAATLLGNATISSNALVLLRGTGTIHSLNLTSGATLRPDSLEHLDLSVQTNALLNGPLDGNGMGYPQTQGPGGASVSNSYAAGASHAGIGGRGNTSDVPTTAVIYGSMVHPQTFGSGGGRFQTNAGGWGGGALRLHVGDTLTVNTPLSVNATAPGSASGGGAGGSVWINARVLNGSSRITANGSNGNTQGGGGSGGRIAIYACNLLMSPDSIRALAGTGFENGGPGTVFIFNPTVADSNHNGQPDRCELAAGISDDCNGNHVIDDAEGFSAPQALTVYEFPGGNVRLLWMCSPNATSYKVYRSATLPVSVIPGNLIGTVTDPEYVDLLTNDVTPAKRFYAVVAVE